MASALQPQSFWKVAESCAEFLQEGPGMQRAVVHPDLRTGFRVSQHCEQDNRVSTA